MKGKSSGQVSKWILETIEEKLSSCSKGFIKNIFDIDISGALKKEINLARDVWIFPNEFYNTKEKSIAKLVYITKFNHKKPKNVSVEPGEYFITEAGPVQKIIIDMSVRHIELISETNTHWQRISAFYDNNLQIIVNSVTSEYSSPEKRNYLLFMNSFMEVFIGFLRFFINALVTVGIPISLLYLGFKIGGIFYGLFGLIIAVMFSLVYYFKITTQDEKAGFGKFT